MTRRFGMEGAICEHRITRLRWNKIDFSPGKNVLARENLCAAFVKVKRASQQTELGL